MISVLSKHCSFLAEEYRYGNGQPIGNYSKICQFRIFILPLRIASHCDNNNCKISSLIIWYSKKLLKTFLLNYYGELFEQPVCAAGFALLNLPKGKSLGRSKPETNSSNEQSSLGRYVFGSEISYNKPPPRLPGLGC
jgi:hypothetical protein